MNPGTDKTTNTAKYQTGSDVLDGWRDDLLTGKAPTLYPLAAPGSELARLEVGPGLVTLIGGAPGSGKTALTMQLVIDALRLTPALRAVVCNVEMPLAVLLDRQLARLSGVDLTTIRYRKFTEEHADRIDRGIHTLESVADRLCFVRPPFDLGNIAAAADNFTDGSGTLLLLDYIQRICPQSEHDNHRGAVNETMDYLRQFADNDIAVVVVSAVGRTKDSKGRSSYAGEGLNLASFRESSELEFGADDAFILTPDVTDLDNDTVILKHLKSRHGEAADLSLAFDRCRQTFTAALVSGGKPDVGKIKSSLASLWNRTPAAIPGLEGDGDE